MYNPPIPTYLNTQPHTHMHTSTSTPIHPHIPPPPHSYMFTHLYINKPTHPHTLHTTPCRQTDLHLPMAATPDAVDEWVEHRSPNWEIMSSNSRFSQKNDLQN